MTINYTTNLALAQPVTGTESGTWGDVTNNGLSAYLDIAIAGGLAITVTTADVTLTNTQGTSAATNIASTTAQYVILNVSGAMTGARNLIVPSSSKWYIINNTTTGGFTLTVKGSATTGVGVVNGEKALVAWNGTDYVKISSTVITNYTGTLAVANGGTGLTTTPANGALDIGNGTGFTRTTLTAGSGISITNTSGAISIASTATVSAATPTVLGTVYGVVSTNDNTSVGGSSLAAITGAAHNNTAVGAYALTANTSANNNTALGYASQYVVTTGASNTSVGYLSGYNANDSFNVSVGAYAGYASNTGSNVAIGYQSMYQGGGSLSNSNVGVGFYSLQNTTRGEQVAVGYQSLAAATTGQQNTAVGHNSSRQTTSGSANTIMGYTAFYSNTTGSYNAAFGSNTLQNSGSGSNNCAFGAGSLQANTSGYQNIGIGTSSLFTNTTGYSNISIGYNSGYYTTTGNSNTAVGDSSLLNNTASNNTALGFSAGSNLTTGSNNIVIGYNAAASSATVSNEVTLGNTSMTSTRLYGMVAFNMAVFEQATISATAATGTINYDAQTQSVLYYTSNASANWTLNIRASGTTSLNTAMSTGQSMTVAFLVTNGSTAYYQSALQVDGSSVTPKWQGGTAPTSGNASAVDVYVITIIKTASATFTALASQTKFA